MITTSTGRCEPAVSRAVAADRSLQAPNGCEARPPAPDRETREALLAVVPSLRAFAISLSGNIDRADDLVQDTIVRALTHIDRFEPGSNLQAWMFTILRNLFHSAYRKRRREVEDVDGVHASRLVTIPDQGAHLDFEDFQIALASLAPDQREALLLVGAEGFSYEAAATICGTKVGTVKSRVNRARRRLAERLGYEAVAEIGPDRLVRAAADPGAALSARPMAA